MVDYSKNVKKYDSLNIIKDHHAKAYESMLASPLKVEKDKDGKSYSYNHLRKKHDSALSPALAKLEGKEDKVYQSYMPALETLTDAFMAYKKKAGMAVVENQEGKARELSELERLIQSYMEDHKLNTTEDFIKHLNIEGPTSVMADILKNYKVMDLQKFAHSRIRKALPADKGTEFYSGVAHYHGKVNNIKYSKRKMAGMSTHDALTSAALNAFYQKLGDDIIPDQDSIPDKPKSK
jgi:hypothetical protein